MILFSVFLASYVLSQFFRAFLAVIAPRLAADLGLSAGDLANMSAAFFSVFAFAQFPLGVALDRIGPRRTVPILMLAGVAGAALLSQAQGATGAILALALIGLGCSPIYMGALYYYGRTESPARFGFLSSLMLAAGSAGNLLAATPLALAVEHFGWRATVFGLSLVMAAAALLFLAMVRDPPVVDAGPTRGSTLRDLREVICLPGFWALMPLLVLGYSAVVVERGLWAGPYLAEVHHLEPVPLGNAILVMALAMSVGALAFGSFDRVIGRPKLLVMIGVFMTAVAFVWLWVYPEPTLWQALIALGTIGFMGLCQPLLFAHARRFFPDRLLGRGITFANFLTIGGAGLVQYLTGVWVARLKEAGLPAPDVWAALHLGLASATILALAVYVLAPPVPKTGRN